MKTLILALVPLIILIGVGAAWYLKLIPGSANQPVAPITDPALIDYPMTERVVNLADTGTYHYVKIQITLEYIDPKHHVGEVTGDALKQEESDLSVTLQPYQPAMDDFLITTLSRKTSSDLLTVSGKEALRAQLLQGFQKLVPKPALGDVYFTDFVVQ